MPDILVDEKMDKITGYFDGAKSIQHNPMVADSLTGPGSVLKALSKQSLKKGEQRRISILSA